MIISLSLITVFVAGLCLQGDNSVLFELTAQALLEVEEYIRACAYAEKAVALAPNWGAAYQTLGRFVRL